MTFFHCRATLLRNLFILLLCATLVFASGCATRVYPPLHVADPTYVYVCDYGVHSSLLLPLGNGQFVEYVYGDWDFAALNKTDPLHTVIALMFSSQAALGRRFLFARPGEKFPFPPNKPKSAEPLVVEQSEVTQIVYELNNRWQENIATARFNDSPNYFFTFVKDPQHYSILHSCNHLNVANLKRLGCDVRGFPIISNFIVEPPGQWLPPPEGPIKPGRSFR